MTKGCKGYELSRRSMLQSSALGLGTFLGFSLRDLVARAAENPASAEHVILFWNGGGMTHLDTWDPKPGRPTQGEFEPIKTSVPGIEISEIFPELAKQMKHVSLIRSIAGVNGDHGRASYHLQTSYAPSAQIEHPGIGSVVVHQRKSTGDLPAFISISGQARRASYLGQKCEAYYVGRPGDKDPYLAFPAGIAQVRGNRRLEILKRVNERNAEKLAGKRIADTGTSVADAVNLMRSPALEAFDLGKVKPETIERYGNNVFGQGALLARRLVEKGVRFVQVNRGGFDTHSNNFPALRNHGSVMDPALAALISDLAASGMLKKTMIIMLSEFGRTPRINDNAGRDHHAACFSCLIGGGGIKGGQVIGSSDQDGFTPKDRPVKVPDLHATVCQALGIRFDREVMTPLQRPMRLIDGGKPVQELLG